MLVAHGDMLANTLRSIVRMIAVRRPLRRMTRRMRECDEREAAYVLDVRFQETYP